MSIINISQECITPKENKWLKVKIVILFKVLSLIKCLKCLLGRKGKEIFLGILLLWIRDRDSILEKCISLRLIIISIIWDIRDKLIRLIC